MTSSFIISNIDKRKEWKNRPLKGSPLGGLEDTYIRMNGNCHPDFKAYPIGNPWGTKMCVRRAESDGREIGSALHQKAKEIIEDGQGYHRGSVNMYDPRIKTPVQDWNPQYYADRRTPWEQDLLRRDYLHWPLRYSGTGIQLLHTPPELDDTGKPYFEYGYSFTPVEDPKTGMRVATSWKDVVPPPKYDLTRLHQPYPVWKDENAYLGHPKDKLDTVHNQRII
jgi:hypothetical protein